ncbi:hypothetical protein OsI_25758 [Oryza sativa Indica Group]|uniref:Uncharacterized protein n=1 Tax=Oryza sativa subsp. indica TaxID=39946 RepID=B8B5G5_ORYSI|nr:hypothetical protein OsI_25758 [Oryza sativa Indica Group]
MLRDGERFDTDDREYHKFTTRVKDSKTPVYNGCKAEHSKLQVVLSLLHLKASNGCFDRSFTELLELLKEILPMDNIFPQRARYLEDEKPLKSYAHPMLENLDKEGLLEQLLQSAALLLIDIDFVGGCSCGLGAGEVTARVEGVGGAGQQCPSCAVDKCKEELSRLSMLGMRRSRGGLNLMDKILAVWEAFGIWQVIYTSMNHKKQGFSYVIALAQVSEVMV